jgi:succinate dehydrogenase / fumarate reductase iron-sulfur subunit
VSEKWNITLIITRKKGDEAPHTEAFPIEVDPDEYVLDGVERVWAFHDRSLTFRHACHHSTCGACGMRVNGVEKLTCITTIRSVTQNGGTVRIEPLRNFPVISDLVVDMSDMYLRLDAAHFSQVAPLPDTGLPFEDDPATENPQFERLVDCIECGCCISACPIATTTSTYMGPAVLAAIEHRYRETSDISLLNLADGEEGVWRCHSAFECSAVCPSNVDPGWRIMNLRRKVIGHRVRRFFGIQTQEKALR